MTCKIVNNKIRKLATAAGEDPVVVANKVGIWQDDTKSDAESLPSVEEYKKINLTNNKEESQFKNIPLPVIDKVDLDFSVQQRRDRVNLLSNAFTYYLDKAVEDRNSNTPVDDSTRLEVLNQVTPAGIWNEVKDNLFTNYMQGTHEDRVASERQQIDNDYMGDEGYKDEDRQSDAEAWANYKEQEYKKILDNYEALVNEAARKLSFTERIKVDLNTLRTADIKDEDVQGDDVSPAQQENNGDSISQEENVKDNWMTNFREISSRSSLSQDTRRLISKMVKLDADGNPDTDDLNNVRYLDPDYVHATLIDGLRWMTNVDDMVPLLQEMAKSKPWIGQVIDKLNADERAKTAFYNDFKKQFQQFWIQKSTLQKDGTRKMTILPCNKPEGTYYLLNEWRDNITGKEPLTKDAVYIPGRDGNYDQGKIDRMNDKLNTVNKDFGKMNLTDLDTVNDYIASNKNSVLDNITDLLKGIGISTNRDILLNALQESPREGIEIVHPINELLDNLNTIYSDFSKGKVKAYTTRADGSKMPVDLINEYGTRYNSIARMLNNVTQDAIESSFRENGVTYYSHVVPSYVGNLVGKLKDSIGSKLGGSQRFNDFINKEYKQYDWFYKNGRFLNSWLNDLANDKASRDLLDHKVLLNSNKIEYNRWDNKDASLALLTEYLSDPNANKGKKCSAWYHLPVLSDAASAEFLKFWRYTDANAKLYGKDSYKDVIREKLADLVIQEYNRINTVVARDYDYNNNPNTTVQPIASYDIQRGKDGNVKNIGGAEFKFFPELNTYETEDGIKFIDALRNLSSGKAENFNAPEFIDRINKGENLELPLKNSDKVKLLINNAIDSIMDDNFDDMYKNMKKNGVLETTPDGTKYTYLPVEVQSKINGKLKDSLQLALDKIPMDESTKGVVTNMIKVLNNGDGINDAYYKDDIYRTFNNLIRDAPKELKGTLQRGLNSRDYARELLEEFHWNSTLASSQIIQLLTTDLAYYKDTNDFIKRIKEVHSPSNRLDTQATWNGEKVGKQTERTLYLTDDEVSSPVLGKIASLINGLYDAGKITKADRDARISAFEHVNVADAQAYRSLPSYREVSIMSHQWDNNKERAYNNIINDKFDPKDFDVLYTTIKPFLYTQNSLSDGLGGQIKVPMNNKNSEFLLLSSYKQGGVLHNSEKLRAINDFMLKNNIDTVQFESAVKAGKQGCINLNYKDSSGEESLGGKTIKFDNIDGLKSQLDSALIKGDITQEEYNNTMDKYRLTNYDDVLDKLNRATQVETTDGGNPNVVHTANYEDYGIQSQTPEHLVDAQQLIGTQSRKLIAADMPDDMTLSVGGKNLSKIDWNNLYNSLIVENVIQGYKNIKQQFKDNDSISKVLQDTINSNERYPIELAKGLQLDANGNFIIPPCDPSTSTMVQNLINSIIKNNTTKQKINGGAAIQASCYGSEDLHIVFEGEGKNQRIKYVECRLPWYTQQYLKPLMDEKGMLDINKVPDELRKLIGYRVPTEDKYSMFPLYIKDFMPRGNASTIQLPIEVTAIMGSDFDVDKLFLMTPAFKLGYNLKQAWGDFYNSPEGSKYASKIALSKEDAYNAFKSQYSEEELASLEDESLLRNAWESKLKEQGIKNSSFVEGTTKAFKNWFNNRKSDYISSIAKDEYDYNGVPQEQSTAQRNNALIDMYWSVLTHPDTASKILNPGGFDYVKKAARITTLLENASKEELQNEFKGKDIYDSLLALPLGDLDKLSAKYQPQINPLSPDAYIYYREQNMMGKRLLPIYANQNANHALLQHTNIELNNDGAFSLNGHKYTSLHAITNDAGEIISKNNANYLAASADMAKDPVLANISQNMLTADASCMLSRLGYNPIEVGILMRQPIITDMINRYNEESRQGKWRDTIIDETIDDYRNALNKTGDHNPLGIQNKTFPLKELMENIVNGKSNNLTPERSKDYLEKQANVGLLFKQIMKDSDALSKVVVATRFDAQRAGAGPTIADNIVADTKIASIDPSVTGYPLNNVDEILPSAQSLKDIDKLRDNMLQEQLPYTEAFYNLGVHSAQDIFSKIMPYYNSGFMQAVSDIGDVTRTGKLDTKTINSIFSDLNTYIMSRTPFFGSEDGKTAFEKRSEFINDFPLQFKQIIADNEDIASLGLIKRLKVNKPYGSRTTYTLSFRNVGNLSPELKEEYSRDWTSLLHSQNPVAQKLALQLAQYNYYRNGFSFGPETFNHLLSTPVKLSIPDYISTLRDIQNDKSSMYPQFASQYIYNHLNNRRLVPEIPETSGIKFTDNNKPVDELTIKADNKSVQNSDFKKVIKTERSVNINGTRYPAYDFMDYITTRVNGKDVYYRLSDSDDTSATYDRIDPLGSPNNFIEYEYGKDASTMKTAIKDTVQSPDDFINTVTEDEAPVMSEQKESWMNKLNEDALTEVYGKVPEIPEDMKIFTGEADTDGNPLEDAAKIDPNIEYKDANNKPIC